MRWFSSLSLVCALISVATAWTEVEACSCRSGALLVTPSDGTRDVPLNAELKVLTSSFGNESVVSDTSWTEENGAAVEFTATSAGDLVRLRPKTQLQPHTRYVVTVPSLDPVTFETGETTDESAPTGGAVASFSRLDNRGPFFHSTCAPAHGYTGELATASDDRTPQDDVWYLVYLTDGEGGTLAGVLPPGSAFIGSGACSTGIVPDPPDGTTFRFVPVDAAGNEAAPAGEFTAGAVGCSATGSSTMIALGMWVVAVLGARRRRVGPARA